MKKKALAITLAIILLLVSLCSCAATDTSKQLLSPAIDCIAGQSYMAKSALKGDPMRFSSDDFARAVDLSQIDSITVTSLPPITDGELRVGSTVLSSPETLSSASVSLMTFHPSRSVSASEFKFKVNDLPYELCCHLYVLEEQNYAPTLSTAPKTALEVSTHVGVTYFGSLPCYDPDGDETFVEIVSYPEKGVLILEDRTTGSYRYIPYEGSTGTDSFCYVAGDKYGNYSASATVSLCISERMTSVSYADLNDSPYHSAALRMTEAGVMSGTQIGSSTYFYPNRTVSRGEFVVMAMNALGITDLQSRSTVFADDGEMDAEMKKYVAAAYELGYIKGSEENGKLYFYPSREITRAEAAVMLASMLDAATPTITPVFSDSDSIPAWARPSVYAVFALGVMTYPGGNIEATAPVTRGDAAVMLSNLMSLED